MFRNNSLLLLLGTGTVLSIFICKSNSQTPPCTLPQFSCDVNDPQKVTVLNMEPSRCSSDKICNDLSDQCDFCVAKKTYCQNIYKCEPNGDFTMKGSQLSCAPDYTCDADYTYYPNNKFPCQPCKHKICLNPSFKCLDEKTVQINEAYNITCLNDKVCNANFYSPCDPCIAKEEGVTTKPSVPKTTISPFVNCNDGRGASVPCRPDPQGQPVYYACRRVWNHYNPETRKCSDLDNDVTCRKDKVVVASCQ